MKSELFLRFLKPGLYHLLQSTFRWNTIRILNSYTTSKYLYGSECCAVSYRMKKRLEAKIDMVTQKDAESTCAEK